MIVEDEAIIAKDIENILINYGYRIVGVYSKAEDAIASLNSNRPDLILMDVVLKGDMDGIEAAKLINQTIRVPIIFITAYADEITINRIKNVNPYGYFLKPFEEKELRAWIETTLKKFSLEEELKKNEKLAVSIVNNLEDAVISTDQKGIVEFMNLSAEKLAGISLNNARGKKLTEIVKNTELESNIKHVIQNSHGKYGVLRKITLINYSNNLKNVECRIVRFSVDGKHRGLTVLFKEINQEFTDELSKLASKLNESNKELEKFAYIASHDLQEPLRMVASYVQLLKKRYHGKLDHQANEFISYAVEGVNRMRKLIDDLLTYSRISSKKIKFEEVDCNKIILDIEPVLKKQYTLKESFVKFSNFPAIRGDKYQINQLFYHLIENAVKFNEHESPCVEISCRDQNNRMIFSISDNGIGIEKQYLERIFEAFQKLHHHKEYPGSGIGLTLCRKIVELHGGKIFVESEPNKGTIVSFELPINQHPDG